MLWRAWFVASLLWIVVSIVWAIFIMQFAFQDEFYFSIVIVALSPLVIGLLLLQLFRFVIRGW